MLYGVAHQTRYSDSLNRAKDRRSRPDTLLCCLVPELSAIAYSLRYPSLRLRRQDCKNDGDQADRPNLSGQECNANDDFDETCPRFVQLAENPRYSVDI